MARTPVLPRPGPVRRRRRLDVALVVAGVAAIAGAVVVVGVLHAVPPTSAISPWRRTISEYGITSLSWVFNIAVVMLLAGSAAIFSGLTVMRRFSPGGLICAGLWTAGLLVIVLFPKRNVAFASSAQIHRLASLVAFLALPLAIVFLTRRAHSDGRLAARVAAVLAVVSLGWFLPIIWAFSQSRSWWTVIPLGLVERGLALTEVVALIVLGVYALRAPLRPARTADTSA